MYLYFLSVRIAALFGHRKARQLVQGQGETVARLREQGFAGRGRTVWFHAASAGEFEQARPLIERLRAEAEGVSIVLTFFSPSGYEMRRGYDKVDGVYYLPFATRRNAREFLDALNPAVAVFVKYEFWPAYLKELKKRGVPVYSVSSIFRERQLFFRPWGRPYLNVLRCFTRLYVQDEGSRSLLERHGVTQVSVAGDTRFDRVGDIVARAERVPQAEEFVRGDIYQVATVAGQTSRIIVAGSTWPEDEELLARYVEEHEDMKLILVPHEPTGSHMRWLFQLFKGRYVLFSRATRNNIVQSRVLVVDTMGLLSRLYRYATVAYVGGGFGVGIHNTIEAAAHGVPVLFGTNYGNFREAQGLIDAGAAMAVKRDYRQFAEAMDAALAAHEDMGRRAAEYVESEKGATEKIYNGIFKNR
jgi:3-deoxy-D-manno-octulosonic-acid transferase